MAWPAIEAVRRWASQRKELLVGVVGVVVEGVAAGVPGGSLAAPLLREVLHHALGDDKPGAEDELRQINTWLETLTKSYGGLLDRLEKVAAPRPGASDAELTALVKRALHTHADLAREFDVCLKEVRQITLSLHRVECKLDEHFHEVRRVSLSLEEIKAVLAEAPGASEWATFRRARPDALLAIVEADEHFLAGRADQGVAALVRLLQGRGAGETTLRRQLGLAYLNQGKVKDASRELEKAVSEGRMVGSQLRTLTSLSTAAGRQGHTQGWRSLPRGFVVKDRYRIEAEVGRGGMASVYRAVVCDEVDEGRVVALKVPAPGLMADDDTRLRFRNEIRLSRGLSAGNPPGIVQMLDYVVFDDPHTRQKLYGMVMEFIDGMSLAEFLVQRNGRRKPLTMDEISAVIRTVGKALMYAHGQNPPVLHRDVKPGNIMVTKGSWTVKLMDFGIARVLDDSPNRMTQAGDIVGTPVYMPPEFMDPSQPVDAQSDVYLMGNLLLELMTFHPVGNPESRLDCPREWVSLIDDSMSRVVRSRRPASMKEFLSRFLDGLAKGPAPVSKAIVNGPSRQAPPSPPPPKPKPTPAQCPACQEPLIEGAVACMECGFLLESSEEPSASVSCPRCQTTLPPNASFCIHCGSPVPKGGILCPNPSCGVSNPAGERACLRCSTPLPRVGEVVGGRYHLDRLLATGGFGQIYLATEQKKSRQVVVKEMICSDPQEYAIRLNFFRREAMTLRWLENVPSVIRVFDFIEESGTAYLVLEYVQGTDLLQLLERNKNKPFPVEQVIDWGRTLCDVLHAMHTSDPPLVWRDLKPDNLMLMADGRTLKVLDLGTARDVGRTMKDRQAAKTRVYTEGYAPPEQIVGKPEPRSDLFALAGTLYHLATGKAPEGFYTSRELETQLGDPTRPLPHEYHWFFEMLMINLSEDVNERYYSAREIKGDLEMRRVTREVNCPRCRTINPVRKPFCRKCAQPLTPPGPPCYSCNAPTHLGMRCCASCGNRLR